VLSTNGGGPLPYNFDPVLTGALEYEAVTSQCSNTLFCGGKSSTFTNTSTYNFGYTEGFHTGTQVAASFNNNRVTTNNPFTNYSPDITSTFRATATQHLLQGFGTGIQARFILQAKNDRRITDSAFRQQLLYTTP
jgi:outer membrane protein